MKFFETSNLNVTGFDRNPNIPSMPHIQRMSASEITDEILHSYDTVIYLGGLTGRIASVVEPHVLEQENVIDPVNLARRMTQKQTLVFSSTSAVGEGSGLNPIKENSILHENLFDAYTSSMFRREKAMRELSENCISCPRLIGTRFGTVIGTSLGQRVDMVHMAFVRSAYMTGVLNVEHAETSRAILAMKDLVRAVGSISMHMEIVPIEERMQIFHLSSFNTVILSVANEVAMQSGARVNVKSQKNITDITGFSLSSEKFELTFNFTFTETQFSCVRDLIANVPESITSKGAHQQTPVAVAEGSGDSSFSIPCPVCGGHDLQVTLDLKTQPLANDFQDTVEAALKSLRFPLKLMRCRSCNHLFLSNMVDRAHLFSNYLYESGTSQTLLKYFDWLSKKVAGQAVSKKKKKEKPYSILEIACNDGSQLDFFRALGWETYGVDPAANIVPKTVAKGHKVKVGFWGVGSYSHIPPPDELDVIVAQNVFAHVPKPIEFLKACKDVMGISTKLYIQTSQCDMHQNGQFDTAYHEHVSFFTGHSFERYNRFFNLFIFNFCKHNNKRLEQQNWQVFI